jgi:prevent-host-death family protein
MTRKYTTSEARDRFSEVVHIASFGSQRVVLTKHGKDIAAVVPISDLDLLTELERVIDIEDARKSLKEAKSKGFQSLTELIDELDP